MVYTFFNENIDTYNFATGYGDEVPTKDMSNPPIFSYQYIDIGKTEFHFHRSEFENKDAKAYFEKVRKYSNYTLDYLVNRLPSKEHFTLKTDIRDPEFSLLAELFGIDITEENAPIIGHFALYTTPVEIIKNEEGANQIIQEGAIEIKKTLEKKEGVTALPSVVLDEFKEAELVKKIEKKKPQSPRIFFLLDKNSVFHILFYDPFHDIHDLGKSTVESLKQQQKTKP